MSVTEQCTPLPPLQPSPESPLKRASSALHAATVPTLSFGVTSKPLLNGKELSRESSRLSPGKLRGNLSCCM